MFSACEQTPADITLSKDMSVSLESSVDIDQDNADDATAHKETQVDTGKTYSLKNKQPAE